MQTTNAAPQLNAQQQRLERVRKYCLSQSIPLDSPRARKYAASQGVSAEELMVEITEHGSPEHGRATAAAYARSLGLETNDPSVRKYTSAGSENEAIDQVKLDAAYKNETFKEAVLHYANSMELSVDSLQVQKYAMGLLKPTGDFSNEKHTEKYSREVIEARIAASVERYANSMGLPVDSEQVRKYEAGQRKGPYRALLDSASVQ